VIEHRWCSVTSAFFLAHRFEKELHHDAGVIGWIVLGAIGGFLASKFVNQRGEGLLLDIALCIMGAAVGGWLFKPTVTTGATGFGRLEHSGRHRRRRADVVRLASDPRSGRVRKKGNPMEKSPLTMAQQVAQAASEFQEQRTGLAPRAVTVVLSQDTLVITLHDALSPAEKALAEESPEAPPRCRNFTGSCSPPPPSRCGRKIRRITGVDVREAMAEVEPATGTVVQVFTTGTMVQVFLLAKHITEAAWNETVAVGQS